ncbi:MAG: divalent-cation tolerance protein CutA [Methylococcaceae bacterium]
MATAQQLILCTCPNHETAQSLARLLVENRLAACVNIVPSITSVYAWQGQIEIAQEQLLLIKANQSAYQAIETLLKDKHPYELPEIIAVAIERGLCDYLNWIDSCHVST